jgi:hypothetical protein
MMPFPKIIPNIRDLKKNFDYKKYNEFSTIANPTLQVRYK